MFSWSCPTSIRGKRGRRVSDLFRGFRAVFFKETLHVRRDPSTLFFSLVIPLLQMVVLGFGIDTNIRQVNTVVYNADGRRESRELIDRLKNSDTFHIRRYVLSDRDLNDEIIAGRARVGIKIPVDYSDHLLHKTTAQVLVLIDGSDSSVAGQAINVTTAIGLDESLRRVLVNNETLAVDMRPKLLFNPDSRSPNFLTIWSTVMPEGGVGSRGPKPAGSWAAVDSGRRESARRLAGMTARMDESGFMGGLRARVAIWLRGSRCVTRGTGTRYQG